MTLTTEMIRAGQDAAPQLSAVEIAAVWRAMCAEQRSQQPVSGADGLPSDSDIEALARKHGTGGWQTLADMVRFGRAVLALSAAQPQPSGNALPPQERPRIHDALSAILWLERRVPAAYKNTSGNVPCVADVKEHLERLIAQPSGNAGQREDRESPLADWHIDHSAGCPILVYKKCSVIESEQAEYVMRLIAADQASGQDRDADAAFEAVRKQLCRLTRFSFLIADGGVRRVVDRAGNWVSFDEAHALFDPVAVEAARAAAKGQ